MLYKVLVEAEISSNLPIAEVEELLQLALVSSEGNEIAIDHKFSDRFAVNEVQCWTYEKVEKLFNAEKDTRELRTQIY